MRRGGAAVGLAASLAVLAPAAAGAQTWTVEVAAGRTAYELPGAVVGDHGASLSLRGDWSSPAWLSLSGGVPFGGDGPLWGSVAAGARAGVDTGRWTAGLDVDGSAYGYDEEVGSGSGGVAQLLPRVGVRAGRLEVELRAGGIGHVTRGVEPEETRAGLAADLRAAVATAWGEAAAGVRHLRIDGGDFPFAGVEVGGARGDVAFWARAGRWLTDSLPDPEWGAGVDVRIGRGVGVFAAVEERAADPLFRAPPRRAWSVGLRRRFGARPEPPPVAAPDPGGRVTVRVPVSAAAEAPVVAGDFNGWTPVPMRRDGDAWTAALAIPPGVYRYAFRRADGEWFVPDSAPGRADDGMGGVSALLIVP